MSIETIINQFGLIILIIAIVVITFKIIKFIFISNIEDNTKKANELMREQNELLWQIAKSLNEADSEPYIIEKEDWKLQSSLLF